TKYIDCQCAKNLCNYPCKSSKSACDGCKNTDVPKQCTINQCTIP
uniref:Metallothionein n=1 Tax=Meloidogyne hapla TaxID=6305 RepID=A0A1I8BLF5_MELHA